MRRSFWVFELSHADLCILLQFRASTLANAALLWIHFPLRLGAYFKKVRAHLAKLKNRVRLEIRIWWESSDSLAGRCTASFFARELGYLLLLFKKRMNVRNFSNRLTNSLNTWVRCSHIHALDIPGISTCIFHLFLFLTRQCPCVRIILISPVSNCGIRMFRYAMHRAPLSVLA